MKPKFLYHYTDINALVGILRKDSIVLWATNVLYLNDPQEILEGLKLIKEYVNGWEEESDRIDIVKQYVNEIDPNMFLFYFLTSFSECEDDLNMWKSYADNGEGCALCFDFDIIAKALEEASMNHGFFTHCSYNKDSIKKKIEINFGSNINSPIVKKYPHDAHIKEMLLKDLNFKIIDACTSIKNMAYKDENEWRYVYCNVNKYEKEVNFRVKNNYMVPYIELQIPKNALKKIIIGPTSNPSMAKQSIMHMLYFCDYNPHMQVIESNVPYRE